MFSMVEVAWSRRDIAGAVVAGAVLFLIASGKPGFDAAAGFAANGFGAHSPGGFSLTAGLVPRW